MHRLSTSFLEDDLVWPWS